MSIEMSLARKKDYTDQEITSKVLTSKVPLKNKDHDE